MLNGQDGVETKAPIGLDLLRSQARLGITKCRKFVRFAHAAHERIIKPFNHTYLNLHRAVVERVFFVKEDGVFKSPPKPKAFARCMNGVQQLLVKHLPSTTPWSYQEFLNSCKGCKRVRYEKAYDSLNGEGPITSKDAEVEVFIKYEKTDFTSKSDPVPRVISPRSFRYNLALGKFIKKLEPRLFKSLGKLFGMKTVIKGYNAYKSAAILREKWDKFKDPVAIGLDASRFDQHVSLDALKWEHEIYLKCFAKSQHRKKLKRLLDMQLKNKCVGYAPDGRLSYTIRGTRMSGDMNTSLGNCVLMCSMLKQYSIDTGINFQLANNGDDCVCFMERRDLKTFQTGLFDWFYGMGFNMKVETPVFEFDKIEFCQTHPIFDGSRWVMTRDPFAILSKDTTMLAPYQSIKQIKTWLASVGGGGLRCTGGLPVAQEWYLKCCQLGGRAISEKVLTWSMRMLMTNMDRSYGTVTPEARLSYWIAYGLTPDEQIELERYYANLNIVLEPPRELEDEQFEFASHGL